MTKRRSRRWGKYTDEQIRAEISIRFDPSPAFESMSPATLCIMFTLGVFMLAVLVPGLYPRKGSWYMVLAFVVVNLFWTLYVFLRRKTLTAKQFTELPVEMRKRYLRVRTMWFHFYVGGFLTLISVIFLLVELGAFGLLGKVGVAAGLIVGCYFLLFIGSFLLRRVLLRIAVEGFPDAWWGKIMLAVLGLAFMIGSLPAGSGVLMGRFLPEKVIRVFAGLSSFLFASIFIPRAVYDIVVGHIHLQNMKADIERTGAMPFER
ncbi:MAG: hypothetical protein H5T62_17805 [Anaerolineae bacterium]|nr:hypothetical protein [Anaerolineae bacterium]